MSEQKNPQVSMYIQAISEQAARERGELLEAKENKKITSKVAKHVGVSDDDSDFTVAHVHSHDNHHTYSAGESHWSYDGEPAHYSTHDTKTGKTHDFTLPAKKQSADQVKKVMDKAIPGGVHPDHAKAVAAEHNG